MYSSATPLEDLILKVSHEAYMYHQVTAYNHIIAYALIAFVFINMKDMINYLAAGELRYAKG